MILYDLWWNPAVEAQAIDRARRIGQTKPVFVHRLIARETIEEKILSLQDKKRSLAATLWGNARLRPNLCDQGIMDKFITRGFDELKPQRLPSALAGKSLQFFGLNVQNNLHSLYTAKSDGFLYNHFIGL